MKTVLRALKDYRTEELAESLRSEGYSVEVYPSEAPKSQFDLIATRGDKTIAYVVGVSSELRGHAEDLIRRHQAARELGYEFQLRGINPPRTIPIGTGGLRKFLVDHVRRNPPDELKRLAQQVVIGAVSRIFVGAVDFGPDTVRVEGDGVVEVQLDPGKGGLGDGFDDWREDFPFHFNIELGNAQELVQIHELKVDTSDYLN